MKMKDIYIVLTHSGTVLSRMIKFYTKKRYSHVSIALDIDSDKMYSFGRRTPYNPFFAGFVEESSKEGFFKRFQEAEAMIYTFQVTDEQYEGMKQLIEKFAVNREQYKFNILGLFSVAIHKKIQRKNSFYCAEFVKYVIESQEIETNLPELIKPEDFAKLKNVKPIYQGKLQDYFKKKQPVFN